MSINIKEVFWTGGFDSTYVVYKFLKEGYFVKPYYILRHQIWQNNEIAALGNLVTFLNKIGYKNKLLDISYIDINDITIDHDLTVAFKKFSGKPYTLPVQYLFTSKIAESHVGISLGFVRPYNKNFFKHTYRLLIDKGKLKLNSANVGYLDRRYSNPFVFKVFGNCIFPVIDVTNRTMIDEYKNDGIFDIIHLSCTCHYMVNGKPCGVCDPCITKLGQHMHELFDESSLRRAYVCNFLEKEGLKYKGIKLSKLFREYVLYDLLGFNKNLIFYHRLVDNDYNRLCNRFNQLIMDLPEFIDDIDYV